MNTNDEKLKKYLKNSSIEIDSDSKNIELEVRTNYEALQQGKFPEKLLDETNSFGKITDSNFLKEIENKHIEILKDRPLPDLLESSELIDSLNEIKPPSMGELYEEKRTKSKDLETPSDIE